VAQLPEWVERGVRLVGPAWAGTRFCGGTREPGPLTREGYELLDSIADLGLILDLSHMDEEAALQSLDHYPGRVVATHANAKALLPNLASNRFLTRPGDPRVGRARWGHRGGALQPVPG
jgi:membrane dipeptidase